ncbi:MAG: leucyl/phenylalanyl-tRNA--protein transferase [Bacteroidia bacterium]|nr:leucyl/phenylalanyl-tRNA--protein transferase [Bacteroidia bacterium]
MPALLSSRIIFPSVETADSEGLLAVGGDLSPERLLLAYKNGIFPWYNEDDGIILWWFMNPRFVLFPEKLKVSKSLKKLIEHNEFEFTINKDFKSVIANCKRIKRKNQPGTWITNDVQTAYIKMHELGHAHSAELWQDEKLVGGLYGIKLGNIFFGESMFSLVSNASKIAFAKFVAHLKNEGVTLIDCQVYTAHLESLGAEMIAGKKFSEILRKDIPENISV